jgi:hypothetical protein
MRAVQANPRFSTLQGSLACALAFDSQQALAVKSVENMPT